MPDWYLINFGPRVEKVRYCVRMFMLNRIGRYVTVKPSGTVSCLIGGGEPRKHRSFLSRFIPGIS